LRDGPARTAPPITIVAIANQRRSKLKEHIVDRKKPSLTSPWKVGFLVALLLVVTALGVSYFITGAFGITWHWIQTGGLSPTTWQFHLGAFLEEMVPLLLLTSLLAFGAYVLVAGAVRRYKAYVDSGVEYKQLLKSIKSVEDLDDEALGDKLKAHPELREFLMSVKHRVASLERQYAERDKKHVGSTPPSRGEDRAQLASDCETLAVAITAGPAEFPREITLKIPELKQIERALRGFFANVPQAPVADASVGTLEALRGSVRTTLDALRQDVVACGSGAREVEAALVTMRSHLDTPGQSAGNAPAVQKRVDAIADALVTLGEETKRIAIAAAMQASGGPEADAIKIAEELKTLATRFNAVAQHWRETAPALKQILGGSDAPGSQSLRGASAAAAQVANRARLWGDRAVAMNEHVRSLERAIGVVSTPADSMNDVPSSRGELDSTPVKAAPAAPGADDDFVGQSAARMFGSDTTEDVTFADIPGFEKERRFFSESPADNAGAADDRFVVDSSPERRWDLTEEHADESAAEPAPAAAPKQAAADSDGFLTGPRPTVSPKRVERAAPKKATRAAAHEMAATQDAAMESSETSTATATLDADADAVDLYALGAVDCLQTS
jgi:hypothetical protein